VPVAVTVTVGTEVLVALGVEVSVALGTDVSLGAGVGEASTIGVPVTGGSGVLVAVTVGVFVLVATGVGVDAVRIRKRSRILAVCPLVTKLPGLKYGRLAGGKQGSPGPPQAYPLITPELLSS